MRNKKLSIIIPTFNRSYVLPYTLSLFKDQFLRNEEMVEIVVCNNASTDSTSRILRDVKEEFHSGSFRIVDYDNHVDVGESIVRSASNALGDYIILWSDDDVPAPMLIDVILNELSTNNDVSFICINRLEGNSSDVYPITGLYMYKDEFSQIRHTSICDEAFIKNHYSEMAFMSVNIFSKECWEKGLSKISDRYLGFHFLMPILYGVFGKKCLYLDYPLCIERHPDHSNLSYVNKWFLYVCIGIPRILKDLGEWGILSDWHSCYESFRYTFNNYIYINKLINASKTDLELYQPYRDEMASYQRDRIKVKYTYWALSSKKWIRLYARIRFCSTKFFIKLSSYSTLKKIGHKLLSLFKS